jgi:TolB-like protein/DNA-binding SARP family transcriptional activator
MTAIEIRLLGPFEIRDGAGRLVAIRAKKNRALLAALALAPSQSLSRERMTGLLWSERGDAHARNSLRQALLGLRADLAAADPRAVDIRDDGARINRAHADVDVLEFQRLAASDDVAVLRRVLSLYRGELLADTYVKDPQFEEWLAAERQRLAETAGSVMERLSAHESGRARIELAIRLVALDPLREASHRLLMQAHLDAGERALALRQYEACRQILRDELQISPGEQTEALRRRCLDAPNSPHKALPNGKAAPPNSKTVAQAANPAKPSSATDDRPLVAVLPLQSFGSGAEMENFCDGLTEDIITGLSRMAAIRVVARSTMFTYKHRAVDIRSVGRDLGARYVLEGSVRTSGRRTRVAAQLIDGVDGHHVWAEQIDRANGEIFELQNDITRSVVASVQAQVIFNEGRPHGESEEHAKASRLLARSWQRFLGLTRDSLAECRALAERALALEPGNPTAHRMLAAAIYHPVYMGFVPWERQTLDQLYAHARTAIESEGADEYCHWAMECAYLLRGEHGLAAASLRRALEINPNFALGHGSMGTVLAWGGEPDESVKNNELALRLHPQDPSNFFRHFGLSLAHYLAARPDKAIAHAQLAVQARQGWWLGRLVYAASLVQADRLQDAERIAGELRLQRPDVGAAELGMLPFANPVDRERLSRDLGIAGWPDARASVA